VIYRRRTDKNGSEIYWEFSDSVPPGEMTLLVKIVVAYDGFYADEIDRKMIDLICSEDGAYVIDHNISDQLLTADEYSSMTNR